MVTLQDENGGVQHDNYATLAISRHHDKRLKPLGKFQRAPLGTFKRAPTLKAWMGATHFLTRTLDRVSTEMSLHVLAYNLKRAMKILGIGTLMAAMQS
jgi:hypothetical protein